MLIKQFRHGFYILVLAVVFLYAPIVGAVGTVSTGYRIASSDTTVDAHNVCKNVKATDGKEYFVPTKTASEWSTFRSLKPAGVTLNSCALESCVAILDAGQSTGDGVYTINPAGTPFQVYCDMTRDGGGWTLVANMRRDGTANGPWSYSSAWWANNDTGATESSFLSGNKKTKAWSSLPAEKLKIVKNGNSTIVTITSLNNTTAGSFFATTKTCTATHHIRPASLVYNKAWSDQGAQCKVKGRERNTWWSNGPLNYGYGYWRLLLHHASASYKGTYGWTTSRAFGYTFRNGPGGSTAYGVTRRVGSTSDEFEFYVRSNVGRPAFWHEGAWSSCVTGANLFNGQQTRSVTCQSSSGSVLPASSCRGTKPDTTQSCTTYCPLLSIVDKDGKTTYQNNIIKGNILPSLETVRVDKLRQSLKVGDKLTITEGTAGDVTHLNMLELLAYKSSKDNVYTDQDFNAVGFDTTDVRTMDAVTEERGHFDYKTVEVPNTASGYLVLRGGITGKWKDTLRNVVLPKLVHPKFYKWADVVVAQDPQARKNVAFYGIIQLEVQEESGEWGSLSLPKALILENDETRLIKIPESTQEVRIKTVVDVYDFAEVGFVAGGDVDTDIESKTFTLRDAALQSIDAEYTDITAEVPLELVLSDFAGGDAIPEYQHFSLKTSGYYLYAQELMSKKKTTLLEDVKAWYFVNYVLKQWVKNPEEHIEEVIDFARN